MQSNRITLLSWWVVYMQEKFEGKHQTLQARQGLNFKRMSERGSGNLEGGQVFSRILDHNSVFKST